MDKIVAKAIQDTFRLRKTSVPWNPDEPYTQAYHAFDPASSSWVSKSSSPTDATKASEITNIALYSWNIDFMLPFAEARMQAALAHLASLLPPSTGPAAPVIFLQECTPSDLATIAATPWVRARFHLTDLDATNWATSHYGTTALVDTRLPIAAGPFRVHYAKTNMDRDALFVDVALGSNSNNKVLLLRLCNSHLESLALDPPCRPDQVRVVARFLREDGVHAGLAAGDFNAIQPFDRALHTANGLKDAYLELGGAEDDEAGFTWGQQAGPKLREQFGCSRMDKVFFCGGVELVKFERFGQDVLTEGERESREIVELGFEKPWVTDHLGVMAEVKVVANSEDVTKGQL